MNKRIIWLLKAYKETLAQMVRQGMKEVPTITKEIDDCIEYLEAEELKV